MSNKTPKKPESVTKSEPKNRNPLGLWLGVGLVIFGIFAVVNGIFGLMDNKSRLFTPNGVITIETVDTPESRQQGLSGRESIGDDEGMLFVFEEPGDDHCFWMLDMNFPIDIIWLDEDGAVVDIHEKVAPETYPESFCPKSPAQFVLEIGSGRAEELEIETGATLRF